jgi:Uma2 family endonuclease
MSTTHPVPAKVYTYEEYLEFEARTGERHSFYNGIIIPMPGGSINHNLICRNVLVALEIALGDRPDFLVFGNDQKIYLPEFNFYLYPDAVVVARPPQKSEHDRYALENPVLIIEVLSPSTQEYDRGEKFMEYQSLPTFREYALVRQDKPEILLMTRTQENLWEPRKASGLGNAVDFRSVGVELSIGRIYKDVELPAAG